MFLIKSIEIKYIIHNVKPIIFAYNLFKKINKTPKKATIGITIEAVISNVFNILIKTIIIPSPFIIWNFYEGIGVRIKSIIVMNLSKLILFSIFIKY